MAKKKEKQKPITTPIGVLAFPHLEVPRDYKGDERFAYDTQLILDESEPGVTDFIAGINAMWEEAVEGFRAAGKLKKSTTVHSPKIAEVTDEEGNEVPGKVSVKFRVPATTETRDGDTWDRKPRIFDAAGQLVTEKLNIGSGTKARISFTVFPSVSNLGCYFTLQPVAVQVLELQKFSSSGGSSNPDDFGFSAEDGFVAADAPTPTVEDDAGDDDEDGDGSGF